MRCPVCRNNLKRQGDATYYNGLPKELGKGSTSYYYCDYCYNNMNRCCFIFYKGTIFSFYDKNWEELKFNPSAR